MPIKQDMLKSFILLGLSAYFLFLVLSDSLKNYINTEFAWLSLLAAALFFVLGCASVAAMFTGRASHAGHDHDHEHGHSHGGRAQWIALGFASVPLLLGFAVPSKPLGAAALDTDLSGSSTTANSTLPPSNGSQPVTDKSAIGTVDSVPIGEWNLYDWQQAFRAGDRPQTWFNGQGADVVGMVTRPDDLPGGHFVVGRWVMRHCAADAFGVGLLVKSDRAMSLPIETWVRVQGKMRVDNLNGEPVLILNASTIDDTIGEPEVSYLFPRRVQPKK